ncbi:MAG: hypothetical protein LW689_10465 [Novosphingobium sp.]|jgi:hypothetical protein|nr:hypothetical protein [Novosphingobium sp.]
MAYTKTTPTKKETTEAKEQAFHSIGAIFETSSEALPFVGKADASLLEALGLEAPEGKEWKIFVKAKTSKAGKAYNSVYLGLSDIRR